MLHLDAATSPNHAGAEGCGRCFQLVLEDAKHILDLVRLENAKRVRERAHANSGFGDIKAEIACSSPRPRVEIDLLGKNGQLFPNSRRRVIDVELADSGKIFKLCLNQSKQGGKVSAFLDPQFRA